MTRAKDHERKRRVIDGAFALFLSLTYMVFASVSTIIFDTFNCKTFGDDTTEYMMSHQSVNCGTSYHKWYQVYAGVKMLYYPVGIPALYSVLLFKNRAGQQRVGRGATEARVSVGPLRAASVVV